MNNLWLRQVIDSIAERGRELLGLDTTAGKVDIETLCRQLLSGYGEASGIALSQEILRRYTELAAEQKLAFFKMLQEHFGPDLDAMQAAMAHYSQTRSADALAALNAAVEPPRQELFRQLNMAPGGTARLVAMRDDLLSSLRVDPELKAVDADLKHLLSSWFNRGFLQLRSIDWRSPAHVLEKLIGYEAVHEIQGWDDLRRRLMQDRRCFAFFHPAMDEEPLIFVEVALVRGMASEVGSLLDPGSEVLDPAKADTAIFYSINNTQRGLRGISFGNFLIKQVLSELDAEFPGIKNAATLSPLPLFATTLNQALEGNEQFFTTGELDGILEEYADDLCQAAGLKTGKGMTRQALQALLNNTPLDHRDVLREPLTQLALAYLTLTRPGRGSLRDPVASFHLSNGASMERLNPFADTSGHGMGNAYGMMVNYLYDTNKVVSNHERFVTQGEINMSDALAKRYKTITAIRHG